MPTIRITKRFSFELANALLGYDGECKNIHGHSYKLAVCCKGKILYKAGHPKNGMVYDFSILQKIVEQHIIIPFDHSLVLNADEDREVLETIGKRFDKLIVLKEQPTCEILLNDFVIILKEVIPVELELVSVRLDETVNSFAEWYAADNE